MTVKAQLELAELKIKKLERAIKAMRSDFKSIEERLPPPPSAYAVGFLTVYNEDDE